MKWLDNVQNYLNNLDAKSFRNYAIAFFAAFLLIFAYLIYNFYSNIHSLKNKINVLNRKRRDVKELLQQYELVQKQKKQVEEILNKEKDFKIKQFFDATLTKLGIIQNKKSADDSLGESLEGYTERKLDATIENINTKQLAELLEELERTDRIYLKEVDIEKDKTSPAITVHIVIATLEPKIEPIITE